MSSSELAPSLRSVLGGAIDYAGLFPPAALSLPAAVASYAEYRTSADQWALGRFVIGATRLDELTDLLARSVPDGWIGARVGVTAGTTLGDDVDRIEMFNTRWRARDIVVDAVETKVATPEEVELLGARLPAGLLGYGEVPLGPERDPLLTALESHRLCAKIRMGGTTAELFPRPEAVAGFLLEVARRNLPFKATAGLHHPLRGEYRLTYEPGSALAPMFGFLNLAVATLAALAGESAAVVGDALIETDAAAIAGDGLSLRWRERTFDALAIERPR
jgi:hypothetical protein